jgi:hypothetical protein
VSSKTPSPLPRVRGSGSPANVNRASPMPEEPPGLYSDLAERPEVKALLAEIQKKLKPGEDPLYYALPEEPPDPATRLPDEARVYMAPTPLSAPVEHKTLEMQKVRIGAAVNPRAAVTERIERGAEADAAFVVRHEPAAESRRGARGRWGLLAAVCVAAGGVAAVVVIKGARPEPAVEGSGAAVCVTSVAAAPPVSGEALSAAAAKPSAEALAATSLPSASAAAPVLPAKSGAARGREKAAAPVASASLSSSAPAVTAAPTEPPATTAAPQRTPVEDTPVF